VVMRVIDARLCAVNGDACNVPNYAWRAARNVLRGCVCVVGGGACSRVRAWCACTHAISEIAR
jgi:hypothetical protein